MENEPVLRGHLTARLELARADKHALNTLLHDYMPFIKKCVSAIFFKGQSKADNLTDAMLAFVHSVQTYNPGSGAFIQYAQAVIRNRLIDNTRKELAVQKHQLSLFARADKKDTVWNNSRKASHFTFCRAKLNPCWLM